MTDNLLQEIREASYKLEKLREEQRTIAKKLFNESFKRIFETYPFLGTVKWVQYTPYFNDGDECTFGVHEWTLHGLEVDPDNDSYYESSGPFSWGEEGCINPTFTHYGTKEDGRTDYSSRTEKENPKYDPIYEEASKTVQALASSMDQDVLKELFGDHASVKVTREGIETESYDHE